MFGKLTKISGNKLEIMPDDDFNIRKVAKLADGKQPTIEFRIDDGRTITPSQRKKIFAMLNDFCYSTGYSVDEAEALFKGLTRSQYGIDEFSLSDCSVTTACLMIEAILEFMFNHNIPFATETWDSIPDWFQKQRLCVLHRKCIICGKHADIDHFSNTIGMGRNRKKINHVGMYIMALCREHHNIKHTIGEESFIQLYHVKPIKVDEEIAKKLHLGRLI